MNSCVCPFKMGSERPRCRLTRFWWSMVESVSPEESSLAGSEGWSFEGGMMDTPKAGSNKAGPARAEMSGEATEGRSNWMGATLGALVGVLLGLIAL